MKRRYDKRKFLKAYKKAKSTKELANILQLTIPAVHNYLQRYKLKPYLLIDKEDPLKIAKCYVFNVTIKNLAKHFELSCSAVRYYLQKLVLFPNKYKLPGEWPPPRKLYHIKIINVLLKDEKLLDNPSSLPSCLELSIDQVNDYWEYAFKHKIRR